MQRRDWYTRKQDDRGENTLTNKAVYKLRFGIIDYPGLEDGALTGDEVDEALNKAVDLKWWPADSFARKPEYASLLPNDQLIKHQEVDLIMHAIIERIKTEDDLAFEDGEYHRANELSYVLRPEIQDAVLHHKDWIKNMYLVDYDHGSKKIIANTVGLLSKAQELKSDYYLGTMRDNLIKHLPVGHPLAELFLRDLQKDTCRSAKGHLEEVVVKLPKELIEKEWPKLTDLVRAFCVNREDLDEDTRLTSFRCVLRDRTELEVSANIPWDFIRKLQPDLLPIVPQWLRKNLTHMTGTPVTTEEFKKLSFRVILKGTNGAKRRVSCDPKRAVEAYDKLFVSDAPAATAFSFMETLDHLTFSGLKKWMTDCGTETSKELVVNIFTNRLVGLENKAQIDLEARVKAEPKNILDYKDIADAEETND